MTSYIHKTGSSNESMAITTSDTATLSPTRAIYVGVAGNITVQHVAGKSVLYVGVPIGVFPVTVVRVMSTGTTAASLVAMY